MLFASFKYHISPSFPSSRIEELKHVLDNNGASEVASGEGWLNEVNLVVSNSMRFEGWEAVKEKNESRKEGETEVYVVTDKWVDRSLVLGKTQSPYHYSPDPSLIFSGVIGCATSLPPSDLEVLSAGITALGGQWRTGLTKDVTHLFAMSPDSQKYATAMYFREETGIKIVLPHWFDDAVRLGMGGLSTEVYEWPDPEMLRNPFGVGGGGGGQELSGVKKNMYALAALFTAPMHESSPPLKDLEMAAGAGTRIVVDVWKGKKIVLSRTLQLFERRREAVEIGIARAGGVVVRYDGDEEIDEGFAAGGDTGGEEPGLREKEIRQNEADAVLDCDILVTRWRDGAAYVVALRSHKTIGTLAWLFHVQSTGTLARPLDQLLHYPVPKRPIEAFSNHVITVTNYTGEAREYLKKLITAMGAKFTPSMSGQNTVLIAAYISGTKSSKAQSWSIPIVNHTWLEDCFVQWRNLTVGLEKYIGFPAGVDFSKLLGVRGVGGAVDVEGLDAEVDVVEAPGGTDASVREVQGLVGPEDVDMVDGREESPVPVMMDVDGEDGNEKTPTKKTPTFKQKANDLDTSPLSLPPSSPISPKKKTVLEHQDMEIEEDKVKRKRKTRNWVPSPEHDEGEDAEKSTQIRKKTNNKLASDDEIQDADDDNNEKEMEVILPKGKKKQGPARSKKSARDEDDSEVEVVSSKIAKTDLNAKGKRKEKVTSRSKKSKDGNDEDEDLEEEEEVASKRISNKKSIKVQFHSTKPKSEDEHPMEQEEEEDDGEVEKPKSNGKVKVDKKRQFVDESEDDVEDLQVKSRPKSKAVTTPIKYTSLTKPTIHANIRSINAPALAESEDGSQSEDELSSFPISPSPAPPPRVRNTKLIRRVSEVVVPDRVPLDADMDVHSEEEREEGEAKTHLSLIEKSQAKKGDARTRVRKRKAEVIEVEVDEDEDEQEEAVVFVKSRGRTKDKTTSAFKGKSKENSRVHHSESDEEDDKPQPQSSKIKTTKKSVKSSKPTAKSKPKPISDNDDDAEEEVEVQQPDSDSDLPAAPFLASINGSKGKRVSGGSTVKPTPKKKAVVSISAPVVKLAKSKIRGKGMVESEDEHERGAVITTPKRVISVLMPSLNLSGNRKKSGASPGTKEVERRKKVKLPVSSEDDADEDDEKLVSPRSHAITRTESIRVMSNHQVQVSTKYPGGAVSGSVKTNVNAIASSSKSKSKRHIASPSPSSPTPPPPPRATKKTPKPNSPSPPVKRSAAAKATQRLHDTIMPDLVHFESQMKRANAKGRKSGGLTAFKIEGEGGGSGGKRSQDREGEEGDGEPVKKKRKVDAEDMAVSASVGAKSKGKRKEEEEEEEEVGAKKRSSAKGKGKTIVVATSDNDEEVEDEDVVVSSKGGAKAKSKGKEKEAETASKSGVVLLTTQVTLSDEVIRILAKLGVKMTSRPSECTHLLAPQLVRTEKFLCAMVVAPFILTEKWATQSATVRKLLPEKDFALRDSAGEKKYGVNLMQSLRRAKEWDGKLLAGQTFYVTPKVPIDTKLLKNVVNACGGQMTTQQPTARIINASPENRHVVSCKEDIAIWRPIAAQGIPIYSQELVISGVLKQEMEWDVDRVRVDI